MKKLTIMQTINWDGGTLTYTIPENLERKLPPEVKERWLRDLRSGEYKQGTKRLCTINDQTGQHEYCCLGVLVKDKLQPDTFTVNRLFYYHQSSGFTKDQPEFEWLEALGRLPEPITITRKSRNRDTYFLSKLNDLGVPFTVIAEVIEDLL
jgi:hypothetical protein